MFVHSSQNVLEGQPVAEPGRLLAHVASLGTQETRVAIKTTTRVATVEAMAHGPQIDSLSSSLEQHAHRPGLAQPCRPVAIHMASECCLLMIQAKTESKARHVLYHVSGFRLYDQVSVSRYLGVSVYVTCSR